MDVLFLTGAGTEPAQSIARRMVAAGFRVYGFDASFPNAGFSHADFVQVLLNLADAAAVRDAVARILRQEAGVSALILAGHYPVETAFEATHEEDIPLAVSAALTAPLLFARAALPSLICRKGHLIAISRRATRAASVGVLGALVEGALCRFSGALFEELRDTGVKAAHIALEGNADTTLASASMWNAAQSLVHPEIVADTVEFLFKLRENNALTELVLRPQATREEPRIPISSEPRLRVIQNVILPISRDFPPEEIPIPTPKARRPDYAPPPGSIVEDDSDDDSDNSVDPELLYLIRPSRSQHASAANSEESAPRRELPRDKRQAQTQGREGRENRKNRQPQSGALRIHPNTFPENATGAPNPQQHPRQPQHPQGQPQRQQPSAPAPQQAQLYPENWHGPRPPTRRQFERAERVRRRREQWEQRHAKDSLSQPITSDALPPPAEQAPFPEFVPPQPRERSSSGAPDFVPPAPAPRPGPLLDNEPQVFPIAPPPAAAPAPLPSPENLPAVAGRKSVAKRVAQPRKSPASLASPKPAMRKKNPPA
jgi:NADP-dependent 3-hydroxy acid dehydrogenase YdfG